MNWISVCQLRVINENDISRGQNVKSGIRFKQKINENGYLKIHGGLAKCTMPTTGSRTTGQIKFIWELNTFVYATFTSSFVEIAIKMKKATKKNNNKTFKCSFYYIASSILGVDNVFHL